MTENQRDIDDVEISSEEGDDLPVTPPVDRPRATEWGTVPSEEAAEETIDQRIAQEEPDPDSAYGAPEDESGLRAEDRARGAEIDAEDDYLGAGEGYRSDAGLSPEESAMHVEDEG